jgi:hypothetical protein
MAHNETSPYVGARLSKMHVKSERIATRLGSILSVLREGSSLGTYFAEHHRWQMANGKSGLGKPSPGKAPYAWMREAARGRGGGMSLA